VGFFAKAIAKNGSKGLLRSICRCDPFVELRALLSVPRSRRGCNGCSSFAFAMIEMYDGCGVLRRTVSNAPSKVSSTDSHTSSIDVHLILIVEGEAIVVAVIQ
jgi:hypothetical protein